MFHRVTGWGIRPAFPYWAERPWPSAAGRCSVLPWETLRARDIRRARRLTDRIALEPLEERQLLSYSSLGSSLPDLRISGSAGSVASWGSTYQVSAILQNIGASTIVEPLSQTPPGQIVVGPDGNPVPPFAVPSTANAGASAIAVLLSPRPHSLAGAIQIGSISAPALAQNSVEQVSTSITLPTRPAGFRASGVYYIVFKANATNTLTESSYANNLSAPIPVRFLNQALPELRATALSVPPVMQPGDTIAPTFQITNLGTASTAAQGPVQVALVASVSPDFNLGSSIVALYTLPAGIPGSSDTPVQNFVRHHRRLSGLNAIVDNVTPGNNVVTYTGSAVTLPTSPSTYYLGIVVDPYNTLNQLSLPSNRLEQIQVVGPPIPGLPAAGVVSSSALTQQFPTPPDGQTIGLVNPNGV